MLQGAMLLLLMKLFQVCSYGSTQPDEILADSYSDSQFIVYQVPCGITT